MTKPGQAPHVAPVDGQGCPSRNAIRAHHDRCDFASAGEASATASNAKTAAKRQKIFSAPHPERHRKTCGTFASPAGLLTPLRSSFGALETAAPFKIKPLNSNKRMVGVAVRSLPLILFNLPRNMRTGPPASPPKEKIFWRTSANIRERISQGFRASAPRAGNHGCATRP